MVTATDLREVLLRTDPDSFARQVFGVPYHRIEGYLYPEPAYRAFAIHKRSGSLRLIHEPRRRVKELQLSALAFMEERAAPSKPCVHGFVAERSIVTNAERHLEKRPHHLLNLDLEDFFPSITFFRVRGVFRKAPFHLSHEVATVLAQLCTYRNTLPQGAPTSPMLSNLVCRALDRDLMDLARRHRATYTRYADDLTFSFSVRSSSRLPPNICTFDSGLLTLGHELLGLIQDKHHFRVNSAKTRMSTRLHRMEVTGVKINEFTNVKRVFVDRIRGALNAWSKHGYAAAQKSWSDRIEASEGKPYDEKAWRRQTRTGSPPELKNVLWGRLLYVRMVRGGDDAVYTRLAERYNKLCKAEQAKQPKFMASSLPVERVVRNEDDAERSTFVLEWVGDFTSPSSKKSTVVAGQGTAFPYRSETQLVSCEHVLRQLCKVDGADLEVDCLSPHMKLHSFRAINPKTNESWPVSVKHRDPGRDLVLLSIEGGPLLHRYFAGIDAPIKRNEHGKLIGYPNWSPGRLPNISTAIVLNRYPRSGLARFEVSTTIRQGNSGGPFLDHSFRVAGVAQQGATQQQGNDECLCTVELDSWLRTLGL